MRRITKKRLHEQAATLLVNDPTLTAEQAMEKARNVLRGLDSAHENFDAPKFPPLEIDGTQSIPVKRDEE